MAVKAIVGTIVCGLCPVLLMSNAAIAQQDRVSATEKGSLLIYSKVEVKWNAAGQVIQDTFIQLTNDNTIGVDVQLYFVNGDPPLAAVPGERAHPGWNWVDNGIFLTANQPIYWSARTGAPYGLSPWTVLDPGTPPGRPDPESTTGERLLRGFILAWAVNPDNQQINFNHLAGNATLVNYALGTAWEYNAWSFQCNTGSTGTPCGAPGVINMGVEYAPGFDLLLMNFVADGSNAFSGPKQVVAHPDLTLHPIDTDLRQDGKGPVTTKAKFDVWNQNETKFSGAERCITCWEERLLRNWAPAANHFIRANLQTDVGKARIDGLESILCDVPNPNYNPLIPIGPFNQPFLVKSQEASLLGLISTRLVFDGGLAFAEAGTNLHGMGTQSGTIKYDVMNAPPPANSPETPAQVIELIEKEMSRSISKR